MLDIIQNNQNSQKTNKQIKKIQINKENLKKSLSKGIKIFLKKEKTKSKNMVRHDIKISKKLKNKVFLSIEN